MGKQPSRKAGVANLAALRKSRGITQTQLAETLSVSRMTVARWESGAFEPSLADLVILADYFGVSLDELVGRSSGGNK